MRESSKIEKTQLPVDTYEGWLKTLSRQPQKGKRQEIHTIDSYEAWIGKRVEKKIRETTTKKKHIAS